MCGKKNGAKAAKFALATVLTGFSLKYQVSVRKNCHREGKGG